MVSIERWSLDANGLNDRLFLLKLTASVHTDHILASNPLF